MLHHDKDTTYELFQAKVTKLIMKNVCKQQRVRQNKKVNLVIYKRNIFTILSQRKHEKGD